MKAISTASTTHPRSVLRDARHSLFMTVVVTGASGHLGACLVRTLLERGDKVRVMIHSDHPSSLEGLEVERVKADVCDPDTLPRLVDGADLVYHLAAKISIVGDPHGDVRRINVDGTDNVARACLRADVRRLVHCSSVHAFDMRTYDGPLDETARRVPDDAKQRPAYDRSKAAGERRVRAVVDEGLDAVIVHPTGVIGPHDWAPSRMGQVFLNLSAHKLRALVDGGFDFVDVRDVADGLIAAAAQGRTNESYLLSGHYRRVGELAELAHLITGARPPRITTPIWMARAATPFAGLAAKLTGAEPLFTRESLDAVATTARPVHDKATRELGYHPRPTEDSIRDLYRWFTEQGRLPSSAMTGTPFDD